MAMGNQSILTLVRANYLKNRSYLRRKYFQLLGLHIDTGSSIGKINCKWPGNITIGKNCIIQDGVLFHLAHPFTPMNHIKFGNKVFVGHNCEFNCTTQIVIGDDCMIASNTVFVDVGHNTEKSSPMNTQPEVRENIIVGNDVWIGSGSIILKGVTIGTGSVIGAGSLVNKSVPEYQIWAGAPARFIKDRI